MTAEQRRAASEAVRARLDALPELRAARSVMAFISLPDELDMDPVLADLLAQGKSLYVPRTFVSQKRMVPVRLRDLRQLRLGEYGIREPDSAETGAVAELDLVIVPGRAFDREGNRCGRGGGFYDAFLSRPDFRAFRCAVAFDCQLLPAVPHDDTDVPVDAIVTERETVRRGEGGAVGG
jgi:5-formyltetrahydrofolate cyclo-ligase